MLDFEPFAIKQNHLFQSKYEIKVLCRMSRIVSLVLFILSPK